MHKAMTAINKYHPTWAYLVFVVGVGPKNVRVNTVLLDGEENKEGCLWARDYWWFIEGHHVELRALLSDGARKYEHAFDEYSTRCGEAVRIFQQQWEKENPRPSVFDPMKIIARYGPVVEPRREK